MARVRVHNVSVSLDGSAAGPGQGLDTPLGVGGEDLHRWFVVTPTFRRMLGTKVPDDAPVDTDDRFASASMAGVGAHILGRNMFTHSRGPWTDDGWTGWWGPEPPYHHPVFVLTQYPREPIEMDGGTTFHFVTDGIEAALDRAVEAAGGQDVQIGGGASVVRQYLAAGLVDEAHIAVVPVILGSGERLFEDLTDLASGYEIAEFTGSPAALHVVLRKTSAA